MNENRIINRNSRIEWVDKAKGMAIILMVWGHSCVPLTIKVFIYSFHMPLFFIVSGFFLHYNTITFEQYVIKKIKTIGIPYIFLLLIFWGGDFVRTLVMMQEFPGRNSLEYWIHGAFITCWFLPTLLFAQVFLFLLELLLNKASNFTKIAIFIIWGLSFLFFLPFTDNVFCSILFKILICSTFLLIGRAIRPFLAIHIKKSLVVTGFALFSMGLLLNSNCFKRNCDIAICSIGDPFLFVLVSILGSLGVFLLAQKIQASRYLSFCGKNSLLIYCLHVLLKPYLSAILNRSIGTENTFALFINSIAFCVLMLIVLYPIIIFINRKATWLIGR